jgi:hypothetical protein
MRPAGYEADLRIGAQQYGADPFIVDCCQEAA